MEKPLWRRDGRDRGHLQSPPSGSGCAGRAASVPFRKLLQLSTSSLRIHGGAIFSAVSGRKSIPISAIEAPEHGACYRVHGFYLTTTFCSTLAQQAVPFEIAVFVEGFPCFIHMDLLQL